MPETLPDSPEGWRRMELARLYGCLRVLGSKLGCQERDGALTDEGARELADVKATLDRLTGNGVR